MAKKRYEVDDSEVIVINKPKRGRGRPRKGEVVEKVEKPKKKLSNKRRSTDRGKRMKFAKKTDDLDEKIEKPTKGSKTVWKDDFYVKAYELAKSSPDVKKIAIGLGVGLETFRDWMRKNAALRRAVESGWEWSKSPTGTGMFLNYVYKNLPKELQGLWDKIMSWQDHPNYVQRVEAAFARRSVYARMHMFLHAFVHYNFSQSDAARAVNIGMTTVQRWIENEPQFAELMDEIHTHKGNFFESALIRLVARGDAAATIFANKTFNRGRGYAERLEMVTEHNHNVSGSITIDDLNLPLEARRAVLEALRARAASETPLLEDKRDDAIDAEFEEVERVKTDSGD